MWELALPISTNKKGTTFADLHWQWFKNSGSKIAAQKQWLFLVGFAEHGAGESREASSGPGGGNRKVRRECRRSGGGAVLRREQGRD